MWVLKYGALLIIAALLLHACSKERNTLRKIDGRWKVQLISYSSTNSRWQTTPSNTYLLFDKCAGQDNRNSKCSLIYMRDRENFKFAYHTVPQGENGYQLVLRLGEDARTDSAFLQASKEVLGNYRIDFDNNELVLQCLDCRLLPVGYTDYETKIIVAKQIK